MAYCRFGKDCDVYMYQSGAGYQFHLSRSANGLQKGVDAPDFYVRTTKEALYRMKRLRTQGYRNLDYAIERLEKEYEEELSTEKGSQTL